MMVERFSSQGLLRLAAISVALVGLGLGAACDNQVRALETQKGPQQSTSPATDGTPLEKTLPTGGGPIEQKYDRLDQRDDAHEEAPTGAPEVGEQPLHQGQQGPVDNQFSPDDEDEAAGPDGEGSGSEEAPEEENWRAPVRGSGGNNPPDFIVPSEPKAV